MALRGPKLRIALTPLLASALLLGGGCGRKPATPEPAPDSGTAALRVSPSELFTGDLKRLEPHLRLTSGCVRLDFRGPDRMIGVEVELWQGGKPAKWFTRWSGRTGPGELSVSLR